MKLDNFVASSDIYDVYESDGMAVRIYKKPEYKEKCLYAALTHARVETTLGYYNGLYKGQDSSAAYGRKSRQERHVS